MQIICIYQKYFVILHQFFGSEPKTNPKSNPKNNETMEATRQHQVRLNGNLVFQYDQVSHNAENIINTIYNTLIVTGRKYTAEWKKEEQGDFVRDVLEIQVVA